MKTVTGISLLCLLLAACGYPENRAAPNTLEKTGYLLQCAANKSCPPMLSEGPEARLAYERQKALSEPGAHPPPAKKICAETGVWSDCGPD